MFEILATTNSKNGYVLHADIDADRYVGQQQYPHLRHIMC